MDQSKDQQSMSFHEALLTLAGQQKSKASVDLKLPCKDGVSLQSIGEGLLGLDSTDTSLSLQMLGQSIKKKRKEKGLTQQEFADLSGVGRRFIVELEQGKETLQIGKVLQVLYACGLDLRLSDR